MKKFPILLSIAVLLTGVDAQATEVLKKPENPNCAVQPPFSSSHDALDHLTQKANP